MDVVVVVVGLFHTYLKYKYFYSDKCIEMVMIITTLSSNLEFDFKMHVIQFFRSHEIYSTVIILNYNGKVDTNFLISFFTLPIDLHSLIVMCAVFHTLFPSFRNVACEL